MIYKVSLPFGTSRAAALRWLRLRMPDYPIPYSVAIQRGEEYQKRDARDRQKQRPVGVNQYSKGVYDNKNDVHTRSSGTSTEAALRRLRKDWRRPLGLCQRFVNY